MSPRIRPDGPGHPVPMRAWPEDEALWLDENGVRRPRAARHVLASLAALDRRGRYAARAEGAARILTGPVSALALRDADAAIGFVLSVTPYGYGEEAF
jgi:hypothetical protein